ncbi:MAG: hypothetical protein A3G33_08065 [Omnitrophica bacterium RIFCSPLOWO2_12_FULL_44_17]|uniref:Uncharacterized protein n=1 Tax=Candidatus Danuiimicrobium aquiferis TaxID=1801832 RepID=A0A1G1KXY4_9BACT|nr:MAG: hypothetical protein A3B72_05765 [Omnitrophica bacterium RIFCSPHIGHO2_02_FULL_45_28]OGW97758.1 MAG: hypothetical protein A3G33_08065 [Omnitrophica bacterium RIFCSPLOWO2_12_FULL_44_17]OGX04990.1 MAG: hypothetical protein A3J12_02145 [Omnitrophica bacterium RIFCSPLOWO2_02_FULL_44_11]
MNQPQIEAQELYQNLKNTHIIDESTVYQYLSIKELKEIIDIAKREGICIGQKIGLERGEAKGQKQATEQFEKMIESNVRHGIEVIIKFGCAVITYCPAADIEILSYKINFNAIQNRANVLFLINCEYEKEFEFSKMLDSFEDIAAEAEHFCFDGNFVNVKDAELDYRLIQFDYPISPDIAFVKNAFSSK